MFFRSKKDNPAAGETLATAGSSISATNNSTGVLSPPQVRAPFITPSTPAAKADPDAAPGGKSDVLRVMGQVVALLMRTPGYASLTLADLTWFVVPALHRRQFAVAEARSNDKNIQGPVGLVLWALVSDEVDKRLAADGAVVAKLEPNEWASGKNAWFMCVVGADKVTETLMQQSMEKAIKSGTAKARVIGPEGRVTVKTISHKRPS